MSELAWESVPAIDDERRALARQAADNIIARRKGVTLGGLSFCGLRRPECLCAQPVL
jgi:hypothetical protein